MLIEEDTAGVPKKHMLAVIARKVAKTPKIWRIEGKGRTKMRNQGETLC